METTQLRRFAIEARNILKQGIANKIASLGFNAEGQIDESIQPQLLQGKTLFRGKLYDESFYYKWNALQERIASKGLKEVYEEAAYTWFNRLIAIRIMQKNGLIEPVLTYQNEMLRVPAIVSDARNGRIPDMGQEERAQLQGLLMDDAKTTEQFGILIVAFCHSNPIIRNCFGGISEYTELLLPNNILIEGGFVDLLNHTSFISDDDYRHSELIGWLYQFYISEKKDEVFAAFKNKHKAVAEDIPAATQIFTPNWIVKYMVQNTVGRIYLDNNPRSPLKNNWKYLVGNECTAPRDAVFQYEDLRELTMADLSCGSGHILNEGFDLLYEIYIEEGYSRRQAIEHIFRYNLIGVDIDTRAKQLSTFALMLKACQKDNSFSDCHVMPRVLDMPRVTRHTWRNLGDHMMTALKVRDSYMDTFGTELDACFKLMENADNFGSIMKFTLSPEARKFILHCLEEQNQQQQYVDSFDELFKGFRLILALTEKYASVVMNPPYMGSGNMNAGLSQYVQNNYLDGKADFFSVFMMVAVDRLRPRGKYGMINMHSWMFLSSFESLRHTLLGNYHIDSMLHLGPRTFDELSGEVVQNTAYVVCKTEPQCNGGIYYRLVDGKNCGAKEQMFLDAQIDHTPKVYYPNVSGMSNWVLGE